MKLVITLVMMLFLCGCTDDSDQYEDVAWERYKARMDSIRKTYGPVETKQDTTIKK